MLTALRIANVVIWAGLLAYVFKGAKAAVTGKETRRGDPMRLSVASVCILIILGNLRWLLAPNNDVLLSGVSVLGILVAAYKWRLASAYGRGSRL